MRETSRCEVSYYKLFDLLVHSLDKLKAESLEVSDHIHIRHFNSTCELEKLLS